ncbi:MAG: DUF6232 family protein [Ketobacteraceae bacterium]|nr:DUF6232 family protein [Ketobacteraceae bacterium]
MENDDSAAQDELVSFEEAENIVINRGCVKFGNSVYQLCNVTGFTVGEFRKADFPLKKFMMVLFPGILLLPLGVGVVFLLWACLIYRKYNKIKQVYGLVIELNSGHKKVFASAEKDFLLKIINSMYQLMSSASDDKVVVDLSNRSVKIFGDAKGNVVTGDKNRVGEGEWA